MTTMIAELYDALLAAGSPEDKARKAAEAMAESYEGRFVRIQADIAELKHNVAELKRDMAEAKRDVAELKRDNLLIKWMLGFLLTFQVAIFLKLFLQ
jgi:phage shock protein A